MLYTISIKNLNGLNKVGKNLIDFNQVSPISVSSPETPYDSFISDTRYNLDGFVQIPLYNRQQYCNIPPNSILTITTENSTEAIYYSTIKIDGGSVTVDPDPISGKGGGGGGETDEFAKKLLARDFENGTLVIPDYITELGPGAINFGFNLSAVKLNPDNISVVSPIVFDFGIQTIHYISNFMNSIDDICSYCILHVIDMNESSSMDKIDSIVEYYYSLIQNLSSDLELPMFPGMIINTSVLTDVSHIEPSFFDITLSKKLFGLKEVYYFTVELDRDELPENILFINYNEQTGEIQNNLSTPDLSYIKGESFVFPYTLEELSSSGAAAYLDLENLPDTYDNYDCVSINSEEMLSEAKNDVFGKTNKLIYKTDVVKDGKNLFIMAPEILLNRKIETYQSLSLPLLTLKYQENRWYALKLKEEPTPHKLIG